MKTRSHGLSEKELELVQYLMADCKSTGDIQAKLKQLFAGTIEQMLEAEMEEHLGYEKHSAAGNNSGNSRNGYGKKTITSDYGECEIAVPRDRNGEFKPQVIEKRQTRTDEIEQKIMAMYAKGMSQRDIVDTIREIYGADVSHNTIKLRKSNEQDVNFTENLLTNQRSRDVQQGTAKLTVYKNCLKKSIHITQAIRKLKYILRRGDFVLG